jgi:hypothetical protein
MMTGIGIGIYLVGGIMMLTFGALVFGGLTWRALMVARG